MARYDVQIECNVPDDISEEEFEEWFKYSVIEWGGCSCSNPLLDKDKSDIVSNYNIRAW